MTFAVVLSLASVAATGPALALLNLWARRSMGTCPGMDRHRLDNTILAASTTVGVALGPLAHPLTSLPVAPLSAFGGIVGAFIAWAYVIKLLPGVIAPARRARVVASLKSPRTSRRARATLLRELRVAELSGDHDRYARQLLRTVDAFCRAGFYEELLELLDRARYDRVNARGCRYLAVYGALAHIHLEQMEEARNLLDGIEGSLDGSWEEWRLAIDAITAAAVGRRREAKALASWMNDDQYALEREVAEAHALAAEGRRAEAQQALMRVQDEHDDPELESLQMVPG
ncbi:MAG: hypothetical protein GWO02_19415, partial [Gammaproteobacteria bacterium]|nr:hypothetical protein [Gammaproteobacteria bacterium]